MGFLLLLTNRKSRVFLGAVLLCTVLLTACPGTNLPDETKLWSFSVFNLTQDDIITNQNQTTCDTNLKVKIASGNMVVFETSLVPKGSDDALYLQPLNLPEPVLVTVEVWCLDSSSHEIGYAKYIGTTSKDTNKQFAITDTVTPDVIKRSTGFGTCLESVEQRGVSFCAQIAAFAKVEN